PASAPSVMTSFVGAPRRRRGALTGLARAAWPRGSTRSPNMSDFTTDTDVSTNNQSSAKNPSLMRVRVSSDIASTASAGGLCGDAGPDVQFDLGAPDLDGGAVGEHRMVDPPPTDQRAVGGAEVDHADHH